MMKSKIHINQRTQPLLSQYHQKLLFLFLCYSLVMLRSSSLASAHPRLQCHEDERLALLQFRQSFIINCNKTCSHKPMVASWKEYEFANNNSNSDNNCCTWDGVRCNNITGHVIGLDLGNSCLYGSFLQNSSLFKLTHLHYLNLCGNNFNQSYIPEGFGQLRNLISLNLSASRFTGQIPLEISRLSNLHTLDLSVSAPYSYNSLSLRYPKSKTLPSLLISGEYYGFDCLGYNLSKLRSPNLKTPLKNLSSLNTLVLDFVDISSDVASITDHMSSRASLRMLSLVSTNLVGEFPSSIFQIPHLEYLDISGNYQVTFPTINITHNVSVSSNIPQFQYLGLSDCNIKEFPEFLRYQDELKTLNISENRIYGLIPRWFRNTSKDTLRVLDMSQNMLTGFEQNDPMVTILWPNLQLLDLSYNRLQGLVPIPPISLLAYNLGSNSLVGDIPDAICNTTLTFLDLSNNSLSGRIPKCFGKLGDSLLVLDLSDNKLRGFLPRNFGKSCALQAILLHRNQLQGKLPRSLAKCKTLWLLDIGNNAINDTFPSWLGNLQDLQALVLSHNRFHGLVYGNVHQGSNCDFLNLGYLDMSNNFFKGCLPIEYWPAMRVMGHDLSYKTMSITKYVEGRLTSIVYYNYDEILSKTNDSMEELKALDLSCNNFTGTIPDSVGNLVGLEWLNFSNNDLTGIIPPSLANIEGLESLDLSRNKLSGDIPDELGNLNFLEFLDVSYNHLKGGIPSGNQFDTFDNSSYQGNPELCGQPLSKRCEDTDYHQSLPPPSLDDFDWVDWIIRFLGYGCGLVVGIVGGRIITDRYYEWLVQTFGRRQRKKRMKGTRRPNH